MKMEEDEKKTKQSKVNKINRKDYDERKGNRKKIKLGKGKWRSK